MTTIIVLGAAVVLGAAALFYALYQERYVKFNLKLWGANLQLEAKAPARERPTRPS